MIGEGAIQTGEIIKVKCPFGTKLSSFYWCGETGLMGSSTTTGYVWPCRLCGGTGVVEVETFADGEYVPTDNNYEKYAAENGRPDWKARPEWPRLGPRDERGIHIKLDKETKP